MEAGEKTSADSGLFYSARHNGGMRFLPVRPFVSLFFFIAVLIAPHAAPAEEKFTLEQVMSAPFVSELTAAPAAGRVAWIANEQGRRNIWVAQPGSHASAQQITHYTQDDGQEISGLAWSADGEWLAYTRGGDAEWPERPAPNPALLTAGVKQEMWLISAKGGEPRDIGEGHGAAISPAGDMVAYLLHGQIWTASLKDASAKPQQLLQARGEEQDLRWSPDGSALAFVSQRDDHSFVGVYRFATKTLEYLAPGTYSDSNPAWSPDSKHVAFVRQPLESEHELRWLREGEPWSICVADAQSGEGRAGVACRTRRGKHLSRDWRCERAVVERGWKDRLSVGAWRLDASVCDAVAGRRGDAVDSGRVRSGPRGV